MTTDYSRKWWALAAIGSGTFMSTIDGSIVNIALNTIQETYNASLGDVEWVVLAYLLGIVCLLPSMGRLGDMIGRCRELKLRVTGRERQLLTDFMVLLTARTMEFLSKHGRRDWIVV